MLCVPVLVHVLHLYIHAGVSIMQLSVCMYLNAFVYTCMGIVYVCMYVLHVCWFSVYILVPTALCIYLFWHVYVGACYVHMHLVHLCMYICVDTCMNMHV